jgi:cobalt/nickel transport system permease protein
MINFTIPATGSSGHLGGGMILAILLGPYAAFLTISSVLVVQALFFGDGGLLALGCNILNMGFFPCFIAYPLVYKNIVGKNPTRGKIFTSSIISAIIGLQLGAFGVVSEALCSGISELPFNTFLLLMQPIHLAIGIVEGFVTAAVVIFLLNARPEILQIKDIKNTQSISLKKVFLYMIIITALIGGILSWFASSNPDGLEWAMFKTSGQKEIENNNGIHSTLSSIQDKTAFLPNYGFKRSSETVEAGSTSSASYPAVDIGTSASGIVGSIMTLGIIILIGTLLKRKASKI